MSPKSSLQAKHAAKHPVTTKSRLWRLIFKRPFSVAILAGVIATLLSTLIIQKCSDWRQAPIDALIKREAELARSFPHTNDNLRDYGQLFADDALVVDYKTGDRWKGPAEIVNRIRPLHFISLDHTTRYPITMDGQTASAQTDTTFEQSEPVTLHDVGKENWQFRKIGKTWKIASFEFDLPH